MINEKSPEITPVASLRLLDAYSPSEIEYVCDKCGEIYKCREWDKVEVLNQYGFGFSGTATVKLCLDCYETTCLWWEDYFEENPEELRFMLDNGLHI